MPLQKEGVILAVEGANQFISQLKSATDQYGQFISSLGKGEKQSSSAGAGLAKLAKGFGLGAAEGLGFNAVLGALTGGIGAVGVFAGQAAVGGIKQLTGALADLAKQAAPLEGIEFQFRTTTQQIEGGSAAMLAALQRSSQGMISNRDLMQKYNSAASLVSRNFAEQMPRALDILTKTAAATGKDINYLFDSFVRGVGRTSPLVLDNLEIQSSVADATQYATEMFGKQEDQLTKVEQQAAMAAYTLERLEATYGAMPDTTETAAAQMSILSTNFQNIKDTLGQALLPAFSSFLQGINAMVGAFSAAISEGGALYPILVNLGAALSIVADGFRGLADRAAHWLGNLSTDWADNMGGIAESAIRWGADIVTNFAVGIIDAANTVLTWAMEQIGNLLTFWLAPGSPPRVAPNLDRWGMAAFESYLGGMSQADFGILESVQGPLQKLLEGPQFADVTKAISGALAGGDRAGALNILANSSQEFGDEIAELARREFALADATDAVAVAENALADAQERAARTSGKVAAATDEYNRMLRAGATEEALQAQLEKINAAEKEAASARKQVATAEAGVDTAKDRVDGLKEEVDWQKALLNQLFAVNDALIPEQERAGKKGKAGKPISIPEAALPPAAGGIGGAIGSAIDDAKKRMLDSLGGLWGEIKAQFVEKWNGALAELGKTWDKFKEQVGKAWDELKKKFPFLQDVEDWVVELPEKIKTFITEGWDKLTRAFDAVWSFIDESLLPIVKDLWTLGFEVLKAGVLKLVDAFVKEGGILEAMTKVWKFITEDLNKALFGEEGLGGRLKKLKENFVDKLTEGFNSLKTALSGVHKFLSNLVDLLKSNNAKKAQAIWDAWQGRSPSPMAIGIQTAADAMERMASTSLPRFQGALAFQPTAVGATYRPAGSVTNQSNTFNFNTTNNSGIDQVAFEAMVMRTIRGALAGAA